MKSDAQKVQQAAADIWTTIAPQLGFPPDAHHASLIRARLRVSNPRIVIGLEGQNVPPLVMKWNTQAIHLNHFRNAVAAHRRAEAVFEEQAELSVPKLLYVDVEKQVLIMPAVIGLTAHEALELAPESEERADIFRRCGRWIGEWHRATYLRDNAVNPSAMQAFMTRLGARAESRDLDVPQRQAFIAHTKAVVAFAETMRGRTTQLAATHGDMNLRNLMLEPTCTYGLDFGAVHEAPIGHDLARFFVNAANFHYPADRQDRTWFDTDMAHFFSGYGPAAQDDPSLQYLLRTQVLKDWSTIPKNRLKRNWLHQRRWVGLQTLAGYLF